MSMNQSAMRGVPVVLQNAATTGDGLALAIPSSFKYHTMVIKGSSGISAGAVTFETASTPDYAGTWTAIGSAVTAVASKDIVTNLPVGLYPALRARISTNIVGGTVTVQYTGN